MYRTGSGQRVDALRNITLEIGDGELIGIMGHTGCGKTTLILLIAGLLSPSHGTVLLDGQDINKKGYDRNILRKNVGVVFQYPEYQLFETTVEKDVAFGLKHSGLSREEIDRRIRRALELMSFDFDAIHKQSPLSLSGGEKRRAAIAGVLAAEPKYLIFDEPVAGLDPKNRKVFLELVKKLNREGTTVIMISHNADALSECAQRIFVLDRGELEFQGPARTVFSKLPKLNSLPHGLSNPQEIAMLLVQRGMRLPDGIITYNELLSALKDSLI